MENSKNGSEEIMHGIKKYKPIKLIGFDFKEGEWQNMDFYPETKTLVIHPSHYGEGEKGEQEEIREVDKVSIEDGL
jgi:hypothetical protein